MSDISANGDAKPAIPTPEDVAKSLIGRLPTRIAAIVLTGMSLTSWITLPLNFISEITKLAAVREWYSDLYTALIDLRPALDFVIALIGPIVHGWLDVISPVTAFIAQVLPHFFPDWVVQVLVVASLLLPAVLQRILAAARRRLLYRAVVAHLTQLHYNATVGRRFYAKFSGRTPPELSEERKRALRDIEELLASAMSAGPKGMNVEAIAAQAGDKPGREFFSRARRTERSLTFAIRHAQALTWFGATLMFVLIAMMGIDAVWLSSLR